MVHNFQPGDFLIFQLESGYALLRVLHVEDRDGGVVWHLAAYRDFFLDPDLAERAVDHPGSLTIDKPHVALTNRAFESTQTSRLKNIPLAESDLAAYNHWRSAEGRQVSDRSIRLLLGVR